MRASWHATYSGWMSVSEIDSISDQWHSPPTLIQEIEAARGLSLVACDGAELAGHARAAWRFNDEGAVMDAVLARLYVAPGQLGRGIGSKLLARVIQELPRDCRTLELEVDRANLSAIAFYQAKQFSVDESAAGSLSGYCSNSIRMRRQLPLQQGE